MSDVSDMLYEFYKANAAAKAPKCQTPQHPTDILAAPTSAETKEPSSIAAIATNGAASDTASKNLPSDEMMSNKLAASFHPRIKYTNTNANKLPSNEAVNENSSTPFMTAIPTSVVVPTASTSASAAAEPLDIKPIINPVTGLVITPNPSVIKPVPVSVPVPIPVPVPGPAAVTVPNTNANPQAAAIAAALIRDGYHSFQQQMRAQELLKFHSGKLNKSLKVEEHSTSKILETFLRQQRTSECDNDTTISDNNDDNDEDDNRYSGFDDIHLMEGSSSRAAQIPNILQNGSTASPGSYLSDESQKYINLAAQAQAQAQAFRNLEFSLGDFGNSSTSPNDNSNLGPTSIGPDGEPVYECRHCGKKYRWKSTLRRHENVECGGKEPSHQCPYCPYKSKQRGNLGVHVRKHHSNLPQLASKRRSKYSVKYESTSSANVSDDSNSKLIIDCSK